MDHVTRLAQALRYDDTQFLHQSELQAMTADELMSYIGRKDRPVESEKIASAEISLEEKFKLADQWGRELAKTAGALGDAVKVHTGKALRAAKGASKSTGRRAAVGAGAGAAGGVANELSKKDPSKKGVAKGALIGAAAGGAAGAGAKPTAQKILKMKGPVGDFARKSVNKSRMYDFVQAVKKPFTKTSAPKLKISGILGTIGTAAKGFAMRHPVQTASTAVGALGGAVGGGAMAGKGKRIGGAVGGGIAGAAAGYAAPNIVKRISQMAGSKINRQGAGTMAKMLPAAGGAGRAAQQTINV